MKTYWKVFQMYTDQTTDKRTFYPFSGLWCQAMHSYEIGPRYKRQRLDARQFYPIINDADAPATVKDDLRTYLQGPYAAFAQKDDAEQFLKGYSCPPPYPYHTIKSLKYVVLRVKGTKSASTAMYVVDDDHIASYVPLDKAPAGTVLLDEFIIPSTPR